MRGPQRGKTARARSLRRDLTEAEKRLWYRVNRRALGGWKFVRQEPIGPYFADFVCREGKLVVELDGSQHAESRHDQVRDAYLRSLGYRVLRVWNDEVATNLDGVLMTIFAALGGERAPSPLPGKISAVAEICIDAQVGNTRLGLWGEACIGGLADAARPKGDGEGACPIARRPGSPPHPRFARFVPDKGDEALSPPAGRGDGRGRC